MVNFLLFLKSWFISHFSPIFSQNFSLFLVKKIKTSKSHLSILISLVLLFFHCFWSKKSKTFKNSLKYPYLAGPPFFSTKIQQRVYLLVLLFFSAKILLQSMDFLVLLFFSTKNCCSQYNCIVLLFFQPKQPPVTQFEYPPQKCPQT